MGSYSACNWLFYLKFGSRFGRKDTVMTMRWSDTLSEALLLILIYLGEISKHSSSNGCLSLWHSITFSSQCGAQNWIFCFSCFVRKDTVRTIRGSDTVSEAILTILIHLRKVEKYSNSNGCMSIYDTSSYSWADMMFTILLFCLKFEISFCWKYSVMTMRALKILSDAVPTIDIH